MITKYDKKEAKKIVYNGKKIEKVFYNNKEVEKVFYSGSEFLFSLYNDVALQTFTEKPTITATIKNAEMVVNLHNGNLRVSIPDISFGDRSLGISISHIYNSMMDNDEIYDAKWTFMGHGFKINYQQYLIRIKENLFYYIDGYGTKHEIVSAVDGTTLYDTSGLGLILTTNEETYTIKDKLNNTLRFDKTTGFIKSMVNNLGHVIEISYADSKISTIVKTVVGIIRTLQFKYDYLDRLSEVLYDGTQKKIVYNYVDDSNFLRSITKCYEDESELIVTLNYENNKLDSISNQLLEVLKSTYIGNKVNKILEGINHENVFKVNKSRTIIYNKRNTEVFTRLKDNPNLIVDTDCRTNIVYHYNFNREFTYSYEKYNDNYTSIFPPSNAFTRLMKKSEKTQPNFNGVYIAKIKLGDKISRTKGEQAEYLIEKNSDNVDAIEKLISDTKSIGATFTFSFWCNIITMSSKNLRLRIYYLENDYIDKEITSNESGWQYITFEKEFGGDVVAKDMKFYLVSPQHIEFSAEITDIRACQNNSITKIKDGDNEVDIRKINKIKFGEREIKIVDIREAKQESDNFITTKDIMWSEFEKNKVFYLNNGKKAFYVKNIDTKLYANTDEYKFTLSDNTNPFLFSEILPNEKTVVKSWAYYTGLNLKEVVKATKSDTNTRILKKYDQCQRLIEELDEYNVQTIYEYNDFGNVSEIITRPWGSSDKSLTIYKRFKYDKYGNLESEINGNNKTNFVNHPIYSNITSMIDAKDNLKVEYQYNKMEEKLSVIKYSKYFEKTNEWQSYSTGTFGYNYKGLIRQFDRSDGKKYYFDYDEYNNLKKYSTDGISQTSKVDYLSNGKTKINTYGDENIWYSSEYDMYDRLKKNKTNEDGAEKLLRENIFEDYAGFNSSGAKLTKIIDHDSKITYSFSYDINESLYKYSFAGNGMEGSVGAFYYNHGHPSDALLYQYSFAQKDYLEYIYFDSNKSIKPRVVEEDGYLKPFKHKYEYDKIGRIVKIYKCYNDVIQTIKLSYRNILDENKVIVESTNQISEIVVTPEDKKFAETTYTIIYDGNNNVKEIIEKITGKATNVSSFDYDHLNRLIKEKNQKGSYTKSYFYDKFGNREQIEISNYEESNEDEKIVKDYKYNVNNKDLLDKIVCPTDSSLNQYFDYINGNPIKYKVSSLSDNDNMIWRRGNLLSKYKVNGTTLNFKYNCDGIRIEKASECESEKVITKQYLDGAKVYGETKEIESSVETYTLRYYYKYNRTGIVGMSVNDNHFMFEKDSQGSIVKIFSIGSSIYVAAEYSYDAWGNCKTTYMHENYANFLSRNPFRWKGHYYDHESGLYYINGNYYDPETGRYINCNSLMDIVTNNDKLMESTFCLENNNPLSFSSNLDTSEPHLAVSLEFKKESNAVRIWNKIMAAFGVAMSYLSIILIATSILFPPAGCAGAIIMTLNCILLVANIALFMCLLADYHELSTNVNFIRKGFGLSVSTYNKIKMGIVISMIVLSISISIFSRLHCFKEGTEIQVENGVKKIEKIEEGDLVWAYNEETGEKSLKKVVRLFRNEAKLECGKWIGGTNAWVHITVNSSKDEIVCTPGHKFYLPENKIIREVNEIHEHEGYESLSEKWVSAKNLKIGDKVLLANGEYGIISNVVVEELETPETTYNFEVADFHTYYVGENGVLAHNMKCGEILDAVPDGYEPTFKNGTYEHNPKHGMVQHGSSSPGLSPEYGQYALDNAVGFKGKALFAKNSKSILQFMPDNAGYWHGFATNIGGINGPNASLVRHYFNL